MSFLDVRNIDVSYGDVQVIYDLSLKIEEGEVVSIIGGNGSGKSTLLRTISGLMQPDRGEITFSGRAIHRAQPEEIVEAGIIHVPEGRRLFSLMTVLDNLVVGAHNSRARGHVAETLEKVYGLLPRLKERQNQTAMTLSGGEQQMVAIGRGLMARPKLLMLDEPSAGLSPRYVIEIFETIVRVNKEGVGILMVEQNARQALAFASKGFVLASGQNRFTGTGPELIADPEVAKSFLGG